MDRVCNSGGAFVTVGSVMSVCGGIGRIPTDADGCPYIINSQKTQHTHKRIDGGLKSWIRHTQLPYNTILRMVYLFLV